MKNEAQKNKKEMEKAENLRIDSDPILVGDTISNYWIPKLEEAISDSVTGNFAYYVKMVNNHLELGIAKVELIQ